MMNLPLLASASADSASAQSERSDGQGDMNASEAVGMDVQAAEYTVVLEAEHASVKWNGAKVESGDAWTVPGDADLAFEVVPADGYKVDKVFAVNSEGKTMLSQKNGAWLVTKTRLSADMKIKVETESIASADASDTDGVEDESSDGSEDGDADADTSAVASEFAAAHSVEVGSDITITGSEYSTSWGAPGQPTWSVASGDEFVQIKTLGNTVEVTGVKLGQATLVHEGYVYEGFIFGEWVKKSETYTVEVTPATAQKTVTFKGNGGTVVGSSTIKVDNGMTINSTYGAEMPSATKYKKTFVGWTTKERSDNYYTGDNAGKLPGDLFTGDTVVNKNITVYAYYTNSLRDYFEYNLAQSNDSVAAGGNKQPSAEFYDAVSVSGLPAPVYNSWTGKYEAQMVPAEELEGGVVISVKPGYELESISWRCNNRDGDGYNCANFKDGEAASIPVGATGDVYISYGMLQGLSHESTNTWTDKNVLMLHIVKDTNTYEVKYVDEMFGFSETLVDSAYLNGEHIKQKGDAGFTGSKNAPYTLATITDDYKAAAAEENYEFGGWKFTDTVEPKEGSFHASQCGSTDMSIAGNRVYKAIWVPVSFTKEVVGDKTEFKAGEDVSFELKYKNNKDEAVDVTIVDTLPAGLKYKSASTGVSVDGQKVTKTFTNVASGKEVSMTVTATVEKDAVPGSTLKNVATAHGIETFAEIQIVEEETFTVTYKPGDHGIFEDQVYTGLVAGTPTPFYQGTPKGAPGYTFKGWDPMIITSVIGDAVYVAQWEGRSDLFYTVNYLEQGTDKVLADPKVVKEQAYGSQVTEEAIDISGYDKVAPTSVTITIAESGNVIDFYYTATPTPPGPTPGPTPTPEPPAPTPEPTPAPTPEPTPVPTEVVPAEVAPMAEAIADEGAPMAGIQNCWIHWFIAVGMVLSFACGFIALMRRRGYTMKVDGFDEDVMNSRVKRAKLRVISSAKA